MPNLLVAISFPIPLILAELVVIYLKKRGHDGSILLKAKAGVLIVGYLLILVIILPRYTPIGFYFGL